MKAITKDNRSEIDKKYDGMYNAMVKKANLSPKQSQVVARYLREIMKMRICEIESSVDMAWLIALIESEGYGTDERRGATKLKRVQTACVKVRNEAYSQEFIDGNGIWHSTDGFGMLHLKSRLKNYGIEYETGV